MTLLEAPAMTVLTQDFIGVLLLCKNVSAGLVSTASALRIIFVVATAAAVVPPSSRLALPGLGQAVLWSRSGVRRGQPVLPPPLSWSGWCSCCCCTVTIVTHLFTGPGGLMLPLGTTRIISARCKSPQSKFNQSQKTLLG